MHTGRPMYSQGYYGGPQYAGHMRPPGYHHMSHHPSSPSFQSMTSHWNLPPNPMSHPAASVYHPHMPPPPHPPPPPPSNHSSSSATTGASGGGSSSSSSSSGGGISNSKSKYAHLGQYGLTMDPPKPPEKPLLPYMRYSRKKWVELKADTSKVWEVQTVGRLFGQMWRDMSEEEKQPYIEEYETEKVKYIEQMKVYKNSPAYKRWMDMKTQAEAAREAALQASPSNISTSSSSSAHFHSDYSMPHSALPRHTHTHSDPRIVVQQQHGEEEEDEHVTKKQVAAMRYHRNHRLMYMLFDEVPVPDLRYVVDRRRYQLLKNQVQSLRNHQKRLENDVIAIDTKYESKKRKFLEDAEQFRRELKKIQDHPPTSWKKPPPPVTILELPQNKDAKHTKL